MLSIKPEGGDKELKFKFFKLWLDFLLESQQDVMTFHSIVHYGIVHSKSLFAVVRSNFKSHKLIFKYFIINRNCNQMGLAS